VAAPPAARHHCRCRRRWPAPRCGGRCAAASGRPCCCRGPALLHSRRRRGRCPAMHGGDRRAGARGLCPQAGASYPLDQGSLSPSSGGAPAGCPAAAHSVAATPGGRSEAASGGGPLASEGGPAQAVPCRQNGQEGRNSAQRLQAARRTLFDSEDRDCSCCERCCCRAARQYRQSAPHAGRAHHARRRATKVVRRRAGAAPPVVARRRQRAAPRRRTAAPRWRQAVHEVRGRAVAGGDDIIARRRATAARRGHHVDAAGRAHAAGWRAAAGRAHAAWRRRPAAGNAQQPSMPSSRHPLPPIRCKLLAAKGDTPLPRPTLHAPAAQPAAAPCRRCCRMPAAAWHAWHDWDVVWVVLGALQRVLEGHSYRGNEPRAAARQAGGSAGVRGGRAGGGWSAGRSARMGCHLADCQRKG
jgi:hypothetical protein